MKISTRIIAVVFAVVIFAYGFVIVVNAGEDKYKQIYSKTESYFISQGVPNVGSIQGEWQMIGIARGNGSSKEYSDAYYKNVADKLKESNGVLSAKKYTEYSRVVLALTSIGKDVTNANSYNLLSYLADYKKVAYQGINGIIWALIALDSNNYAIPENQNATKQTTRELLINDILNKEISGGGWALSGTTPDPDLTAMAITALAPYYSKTEIKTSIDKGVKILSDLQKSSGGYSGVGIENSESAAQVIICLTSLGINPDKDSRFIKNGKSLLEALLEYSISSGGFSHEKSGKYNQMASEQCFLALVAYDRFINGKTSIYNMTDVFNSEDDSSSESTTADDLVINTSFENTTVSLEETTVFSTDSSTQEVTTLAEKVVVSDDEYTTSKKVTSAENTSVDFKETVSENNNVASEKHTVQTIVNNKQAATEQTTQAATEPTASLSNFTNSEETKNCTTSSAVETTISTTAENIVSRNNISENKSKLSSDNSNILAYMLGILGVGVLVTATVTVIMIILKKKK
jgi:hypothetical protein